MRILFQLLGRHWCGVRGWVYLFSLALVVLVYWMLPGSSVVRSWTFEGEARFQGFTQDHQRLVITQHRQSGVLFHQLDLATGRCTTYLPLEHPDRELDYQSLMKEVPSLLFTPEGLFLLKPDGKKTNIPCNLNHVTFVYASSSSSLRSMGGYYLSSREAALSDNDRWLIITRKYPEFWQPLLQWAQRTFSWNPSYLSDGWRYTAAIIDLNTNQEIACPLRTHSQPRYAIQPEGLGYAVFDELATHSSTSPAPTWAIANSVISTISWYALPPGKEYHSLRQWGFIVGAFVVPVLLVMLLNLYRYRRVARV